MISRKLLVSMMCISLLGLTACDEIKLSNGSSGGASNNTKNGPFSPPSGAEVFVDGNRMSPVINAVSVDPNRVERLAFYTDKTGHAQVGENIIPFTYQMGPAPSKTADYSDSCSEGSSGRIENWDISYYRTEGEFVGSITILDGECVNEFIVDEPVAVINTALSTVPSTSVIHSCFIISGTVTPNVVAVEEENAASQILTPQIRVQEYFEMSPGGCDYVFR